MRLLIATCLFIVWSDSFGQQSGPTAVQNDSLTSSIQKTWYSIGNERYSKVGGNCNYGLEITFHKFGRKATLYRCELGKWTKHEYVFEITTSNRRHYAELLNAENNAEYKIEIQFIRIKNGLKTELSFFTEDNQTYFTLISDGNKKSGKQ